MFWKCVHTLPCLNAFARNVLKWEVNIGFFRESLQMVFPNNVFRACSSLPLHEREGRSQQSSFAFKAIWTKNGLMKTELILIKKVFFLHYHWEILTKIIDFSSRPYRIISTCVKCASNDRFNIQPGNKDAVVSIYCTLLFFSFFPYNEPQVLPIGLLPRWRKRWIFKSILPFKNNFVNYFW